MTALLPRVAASALSGMLLVFISAPANLHQLHWLAFVPMLWASRPGEHRTNALIGWFGGAVAIFWLYFWLIETIIRFSSVPWVLALLVHLLFTALFSLPYLLAMGPVQWLRERLGLGWVFAFPTLWVALEMLPGLFPYYHGVSQYRNPLTWQLASVTGVTGLTWLVWLTNSLGTELLWRRAEGRRPPWGALLGAAALWLGNIAYGSMRIDQVEAALAQAPVVRVAILQQDTTMEIRLDETLAESLQGWLDQTIEVAELKPDLVVWPEGAISFNPDEERKARWLDNLSPKELFSGLTSRFRFQLLIGGGTLERLPARDELGREWISYNSAYAYDHTGALTDRYDKMVPLPFGEYIPFADQLPWLREMIQGPGDFRAGERPTVFHGETAEGVPYTYSVPICYEAILNAPMWDLFHGDEGRPVDFFTVITNDAWFGDTASPHQHAMLTTVQAMHYGRPMARLAYTGVSFIVEPHGKIVGETGSFEDVVAVEELRMGAVDTLYLRGGWIFPYLCVGATGLIFAVAGRRGVTPPPPAA